MSEIKPYQPSNGTEGEIFTGKFCERCIKHPIDYDAKNQCSILLKTFIYSVRDSEYPKQWIQDKSGARCTSFKSRVKENEKRRKQSKTKSKCKNKNQIDLF